MPPQYVVACKVDDQPDIGIVSGLSLLSYDLGSLIIILFLFYLYQGIK